MLNTRLRASNICGYDRISPVEKKDVRYSKAKCPVDLGFFVFGEDIVRRNMVGYNKFSVF